MAVSEVFGAEREQALAQLRAWTVENFADWALEDHPDARRQVVALIQIRAAEMGVPCSPEFEREEAGWRLVLNPRPERPLIWEGEGA